MINPESVPANLHPLIALVERWSFSDDEERLERITAATPEERADFIAVMKMHEEPLRAWLRATDVTESDDLMAIAWLDSALAELEAIERKPKP